MYSCRKKIILILIFLSNMWFLSDGIAHDETKTHPNITAKAVEKSNLDAYLRFNLGFLEGIKKVLEYNGNYFTIERWLKEGSTLEDKPICRASNHFHNPLDPWNLSYMSDEPWYVSLWCDATGYATRYSNITWGTGYLLPDGPITSRINQQMGWDNAKDDYYIALTSIFSENHETYLAKTFQALGQVLHLLQDVSVPAHVRNDFRSHLEFLGITPQTLFKPSSWFGNIFEHYVMNHPGFVSIQSSPPSFTNPRVTDFWDTDQFRKGDPPLTNIPLGLAEVTNANYLSDNTIPNNLPGPEHWFIYPMLDSTNYRICEDYAPDSMDIEKYISRKECPPLSQERLADHFAAISLLNEEPSITSANIPFLRLELDDNVHNTYAKELIPRAVGYSAALLDYFFRGSIAITLPDTGVYAQTENRDEGFKKVMLSAQNTSPAGEEMTDGSIELVVKYRLALEDPFQSYPVETTWEYSYIIVPELNNTRSIPRTSPVKLEFDLSQNPIPINATDLYLQIVYKGKLGQEEGAVAVGTKDISEPTPIDIFNDMDRICINGNWYVAGSPEAIAQVDWDQDGIIDWNEWDVFGHDLKDIYIRFSSSTDPKYASSTQYNLHIPLLSTGQFYIRQAFVLTDYQFSYSSKQTVINVDSRDPFISWIDPYIIPDQGLKNQTDYVVYDNEEDCAIFGLGAPCGIYIRTYPTFHTFRDQLMWFELIYENKSYPVGSSCP